MKVAVIMGSTSDWDVMKVACETLEELGIEYEKRVISAHRTPDLMYEYAKSARERGIGAIIAGVKSVGRIMATTEGLRGTMTLMYKLYDYLQADRLGMASTIAVIMVVLLAGISLARVRKMLKKENSYD